MTTVCESLITVLTLLQLCQAAPEAEPQKLLEDERFNTQSARVSNRILTDVRVQNTGCIAKHFWGLPNTASFW